MGRSRKTSKGLPVRSIALAKHGKASCLGWPVRRLPPSPQRPPPRPWIPAMDPCHEPGYLSGAQSIRSSHCSSRNLQGVSTRKPQVRSNQTFYCPRALGAVYPPWRRKSRRSETSPNWLSSAETSSTNMLLLTQRALRHARVQRGNRNASRHPTWPFSPVPTHRSTATRFEPWR